MISLNTILKLCKGKKAIILLRRLRLNFQMYKDNMVRLNLVEPNEKYWVDDRINFTEVEMREALYDLNIDLNKNSKRWYQFGLNETEALVKNSMSKLNINTVDLNKIKYPKKNIFNDQNINVFKG